MVKKSKTCPCGSGNEFKKCCGPFLDYKTKPETAEKLMRSRYTAYVLKNSDYILKTWHPSTRPASFDLSNDITEWDRLEIVSTENGTDSDDKGQVMFKAFYKHLGQKYCIQEVSRFVKENGDWIYLFGEQSKTIILV